MEVADERVRGQVGGAAATALATAALIFFAAPLALLLPLAGLSVALAALKLLGVIEAGWAGVALPAALAAAWGALALWADGDGDW